jgi:F-type H+-transporting ATPase subunit b
MELSTFLAMIPPFTSFVILAALMTYLLYKPVQRVLGSRAERVANDIQEAADKNTRATELKAEYEQMIKDIELERTAILDKARKQAFDQSEVIVEAAKAEAQEVKERASKDIAAEYTRVRDVVYQALIDNSTSTAEQLIAVSINKQAHDKLFKDAMADLESTVFRTMGQPATA